MYTKLFIYVFLVIIYVRQIGTWDSQQGLEITRPILQPEADGTQASNRTLKVTTIKVATVSTRVEMRTPVKVNQIHCQVTKRRRGLLSFTLRYNTIYIALVPGSVWAALLSQTLRVSLPLI